MPRKHKGGKIGTILFSHKFGARRRWVVNVTPWQPCLRERDLAPSVQEVGWAVDRPARRGYHGPLSDDGHVPLSQLTDGIILEVYFNRSLHGRHWVSKEARPGRRRTVRTMSLAYHDEWH